MSLRLVFMGTPDFAVPVLEALIARGHAIAAVYCQPPRPAGRGLAPRVSAVHAKALEQGIDVRTPASLKTPEARRDFASLAADAAVVVAYGLLLPKPVLEAPRLGCFNVHASLLPRWRGAAPIQRAIMAGDAETGVSIMRMEEGLDSGPVCAQETAPIHAGDTAGALHDRLAATGARLMADALDALEAGRLRCTPQAPQGVTYAAKIGKDEARLDFTQPALALCNRIHALSPQPGAWFMANGARIRILRCEAVDDSGEPGSILDTHLTIACGQGAIRPLTVQREGKGPMDTAAFLRGFPAVAGTRLSDAPL